MLARRAIPRNEAIDIESETIRLRDERSGTKPERSAMGSSPITTNFLAGAIAARRSELLDQQIRRDSQRLSEPLNLYDRQSSLARKELRHASTSAHERRQLGACHPTLLEHEVDDALRSAALVERLVSIVIVSHENREELQSLVCFGAAGGIAVEQTIDLRYSGAVFLCVPQNVRFREIEGGGGHWITQSLVSEHITDADLTPESNIPVRECPRTSRRVRGLARRAT